MTTTTNTNTLNTLRNTTSLVAKAEVNGNTIEMLMDAQEVSQEIYRTHFLVINGEWDMTNIRCRKDAQREYDNTVSFWTEME